MSIDVVLEGGPFAGEEMALIGPDFPPPYLMLAEPPEGVAQPWLLVGVGWDDHWPGQQRYDLDLTRVSMMVTEESVSGEAVYVHVE